MTKCHTSWYRTTSVHTSRQETMFITINVFFFNWADCLIKHYVLQRVDCIKNFSHQYTEFRSIEGRLSLGSEPQFLFIFYSYKPDFALALSLAALLFSFSFSTFYSSIALTESRVNFLLLSWWFTVLIRAKSSRQRWGEVEDGRGETMQRRHEWLLGGKMPRMQFPLTKSGRGENSLLMISFNAN